jgi:hypothetical protein
MPACSVFVVTSHMSVRAAAGDETSWEPVPSFAQRWSTRRWRSAHAASAQDL